MVVLKNATRKKGEDEGKNCVCPHAGDGGVAPTYNSFLPAVQKRGCLFCFILVLAKGAFFSHGFLLLLAKSRDSFFPGLRRRRRTG